MLRMGNEPGAARWQAQTDPLCYGDLLDKLNSYQIKNLCTLLSTLSQLCYDIANFTGPQFGGSHDLEVVSLNSCTKYKKDLIDISLLYLKLYCRSKRQNIVVKEAGNVPSIPSFSQAHEFILRTFFASNNIHQN